MHMNRCILTVVFMVLSAAVHAAVISGRDYVKLDTPQPSNGSGKIEVIEFFSWGCPHCYEFHPLLERWTSKLPGDVTFRRVAVGFGRPQWMNLAKAFYALEITGDLARVDSQMFDAIHKERLSLFDER